MSTRNYMKSVIAQGSTATKAIEEALKKAGMPAEFFVKILEDAQSGFLGFGAKKAKIALFFKHNAHHSKKDGLLNQDNYKDMFDNQDLDKQIEQELKSIQLPTGKPTSTPRPQQNRMQQQPQTRPMRPMHKNIGQNQPKNTPSTSAKQPIQQPQPKPTLKHEPRPNLTPKNQTHNPNSLQRQSPNQPKQATPISKLVVRPLTPKKNDPTKS
jgi:hypothetical protein